MATISVSGSSSIVSGKTLSATVTYTVSSSDTVTTLALSTGEWVGTGASGTVFEVSLNFPNQPERMATQHAGYGYPTGSVALVTQRTCARSTSAQSYTLTLKLWERNPSTNVDTLKGTKTATITVPALASYTIKYNANGHGTAPGNQTKYHGINLALRSAITATGYSFARWNTNSSDTGTAYNAGDYYTANAAATLYAIWDRTVTYNANGGTGAPSSQTARVSTPIIITSSTPTRDGYKFVGWNTSSDGSGTSYSASQSYATGNPNITLYAQWEPSISSVSIGSINAIRTENNTAQNPVECDEGTYAYIKIPYTVSGAASADVSMSMTVSADSGTTPTITLVSSTATKTAGNTLSGTFIARAGVCNVDVRYTFTVLINALYPSNSGQNPTQTSVTGTKTFVLPTAYFTFDVKAGGHGVHFGGSAIEDGFHVSMPSYFNDLTTFYKTAKRVLYNIYPNVVPSSNTYTSAYTILHADNTELGGIYGMKDTDNVLGVQLEVARTVDSTRYINNIRLWIDDEGKKSVTVSSPAAWRTALGTDDVYVNKSGDTMTGNLTINRSSGGGGITSKRSNITADETAIESNSIMGYRRTADKEDYTCFYSETVKTAAGGIYQSYVVRQYVTGTEYTHGFYLRLAADGTRTVTFTNDDSRDAWANGLNVVKKAGDTMTGSLEFKSSNINRTTPSSSTAANAYMRLLNNNSDLVGWVRNTMSADAYCTLDLYCKYPNVDKYASLRLGTKSDGTQWVGVSNSAAWRTAIGAVSKGGDTVSGTITVSINGSAQFYGKHTGVNMKASNNGVSSNTWWGLGLYDNNGYIASAYYGYAGTDGKAGAAICAYNRTTSGDQAGSAAIYVYVDKSGTASYSVTNPAAFRTAIACAASSHTHAASAITSGSLAIARGGTGTTHGIAWTQIAQVQGTNSATYSLSGYTECMLMIWKGTEYLSTITFPSNSIGSTQYEMYTGGWGNNSTTSNRMGVAKVSNAKLTGVAVRTNNTDVTSSAYFRLYAR